MADRLAVRLQEGKWELVRDTLKKVGGPTTAAGLGVSDDMVIEALVKAGSLRDRYSILDRKPLDEGKARKLAQATGVIS